MKTLHSPPVFILPIKAWGSNHVTKLKLYFTLFILLQKSNNIYRISNELSFITKFITWVGKDDIMRGSAEHNIIFANECNKFSNKWQRIWDCIYYITVKTIGISIFQL